MNLMLKPHYEQNANFGEVWIFQKDTKNCRCRFPPIFLFPQKIEDFSYLCCRLSVASWVQLQWKLLSTVLNCARRQNGVLAGVLNPWWLLCFLCCDFLVFCEHHLLLLGQWNCPLVSVYLLAYGCAYRGVFGLNSLPHEDFPHCLPNSAAEFF